MTVARSMLLCAVCATFVAGCKSHDTLPSPGMADSYPAPLNDPNITILAPELRPWLGFQPAVIFDDGERGMRVEQPMRNLSYEKYLLEYRILFHDENGLELKPVMGWEFISVDPKQLVRLGRSATSADAKDYRIEVRWSR
jgi:uncharacterized protein YcfL